ncbi:hypothetical protein NKJ16_08480 [Mesorhizobium sp. M0179]|uniref:hypothetical protein n=1 Tax=Mesorhizobium sp. M0179 TaxID=2956905 RepID=UPI00333BB34B
MNAPSDSLDDLESDIRHVATLIRTTYDVAVETPMPENASIAHAMQQVQDLLWIARDLSSNLIAAADACHTKALKAGRVRKAVRA